MVLSSSCGAPAGKILGKGAGVLSFVEVVRSPAVVVVDRPQVQPVPVVWCEMENIILMDREQEMIRQAVDCYAMECVHSDPLGKDSLAGGSKFRGSCGCSLARSMQRAAVGEGDASEGFVSRRGNLACSRKRDGDTLEEFGVLRKLLGLFEAWLGWACERRHFLGLHSSVGLKWRIGRLGLSRLLKSGYGLGWRRFRDWFRTVGSRSKKSSLSGLDQIRGSNACSVGLRASSGSTLGLTTSAGDVTVPAPFASSCSSGDCSLSAVHSPLKVSPPMALVEVIATVPKQSAVSGNPTLSAPELLSASLGSFALGKDPLLPSSSEVNCDLMAPSPALHGFGPAPGVCFSEAAALGERLRFSLPVMADSGAPIYPSESKSVLKYSRKNKVGKMDKLLLEEALETFGAPKAFSLPSFGDASKPFFESPRDGLMSTPTLDEGCQPFLRRGFLLPKGTTPSPSEVGESPGATFVDDSSRGGGLEKLGGSLGTALDLSLCFQTLGISHEGNEQTFLDFMAQIDAEHRLEAPAPTPKFKGCREVKNLECTINYDARSFGSSRGKARGPLM